MPETGVELTRTERLALALGRLSNERDSGKRMQARFLRAFTQPFVRFSAQRRTFVAGLDLLRTPPTKGVMLAANHRTFWDQYIAMLCMYDGGIDWPKNIFFPVRSNFFYEKPVGIAVNFLIGAGTMYPPIFRDKAKAALNKDALERATKFLQQPGTLVGVHPEGTRGKHPDPYELLPAQPGIGQMILHAKPIVMPFFINGMTNDIVSEVRNLRGIDGRRKRPIVVVFGEPVDYSEYLKKKPRLALYKRTSDHVMKAIAKLGEQEREIRGRILAGEIPDDHPDWLANLREAHKR